MPTACLGLLHKSSWRNCFYEVQTSCADHIFSWSIIPFNLPISLSRASFACNALSMSTRDNTKRICDAHDLRQINNHDNKSCLPGSLPSRHFSRSSRAETVERDVAFSRYDGAVIAPGPASRRWSHTKSEGRLASNITTSWRRHLLCKGHIPVRGWQAAGSQRRIDPT